MLAVISAVGKWRESGVSRQPELHGEFQASLSCIRPSFSKEEGGEKYGGKIVYGMFQ